MDVAIATSDGRIVTTQRLATDATHGAEQVVDRAIAAARTLIAEHGDGPPTAVAAASPGIVLEDRILLAPNVPGWTELALAARLRDGLGVEHVTCATDVKAATLAELRWGALRDADPGVFVNLGTGLAAGIAVGGRVLNGANGAAGEIGYALRGAAVDGPAVLEEAVGGRAIGERGNAPSAADVFARAAAGEADAERLIADALDELAVHVANLAILIDPARIAVGGGMMGAAKDVLSALRRRVTQAVPFPPEVVAAHFTYDAALHGAVALALAAATTEEEQHHEDHHHTRPVGVDVRGRDRRPGGVR